MQNSQEHCSPNWDGWVTVQKSPGWLCMHNPYIQRFTRYSFYTLCDVFLCTVGGFYTEKLYSQSKHRSKKVTRTSESQFTSTKACSAVTRLNSCSVDTLTSLIFLKEEELPCKPAEQQGLGGQADSVCTWCWGALWEPNTRACAPPRPRLAQCSAPPSPRTCQTPRTGPSHLMALVASGYADCISFSNEFHS